MTGVSTKSVSGSTKELPPIVSNRSSDASLKERSSKGGSLMEGSSSSKSVKEGSTKRM